MIVEELREIFDWTSSIESMLGGAYFDRRMRKVINNCFHKSQKLPSMGWCM